MKTIKRENTNRIYVQVLAAVLLVITLMGSMDLSAFAANSADYSAVFNAQYYACHYSDLQAAFGNNEAALLNHFITSGMKEGRQANEEFNVQAYRNRYADLQSAYGDNLPAYYMHYINSGKAEGRNARPENASQTQNTASSYSQPESVYFNKIGETRVHVQTTRNGNYIYSRCDSSKMDSYQSYSQRYSDPGYYAKNVYWSTYLLDAIDAAGCLPTDTPYQKAVKIADYVCKNCTYQKDVSHDADWYGTIVLRRAKCAGYASAVANMCQMVGVEAYVITGSGNSSNHGWNIFFFGDTYCYADACWSDRDGEYERYGVADFSNGSIVYKYRRVREIKRLYSAAEFHAWGYEFVDGAITASEYRYSTIGVPGVN